MGIIKNYFTIQLSKCALQACKTKQSNVQNRYKYTLKCNVRYVTLEISGEIVNFSIKGSGIINYAFRKKINLIPTSYNIILNFQAN